MQMFKIAVLSVVTTLATNAFALDDTIENREREASRYENNIDMKPVFDGMRRAVVHQVWRDPSLSDMFVDFLRTEVLRESELKAMVHRVNVESLTANELEALANFYSSPEGASIDKKKPQIKKIMDQALRSLMKERMPGKMQLLQLRVMNDVAEHPESGQKPSK